MKHLRANLAYLADREKLNDEQLGKIAGVNQSTMNRMRNGRTPNPGVASVHRLARHFGISVDDMLDRDLANDGPSQASQPMKLDKDTMASALVAVKDAMAHFKVDLKLLWKVPSVVIYAYVFRSLQPRDMSKDQYALFDESVRNSVRGELDELGAIPAAATERGKRRNGAPAKRAAG